MFVFNALNRITSSKCHHGQWQATYLKPFFPGQWQPEEA